MSSTHFNRPPRNPNERALRYVEAALKRNPATQSPEILEIRDRFLGQRSVPAAQTSRFRLEELHETQLNVIEEIRGDFWTSDLQVILGALNELDGTPFPDVRTAAHRLRTVLKNRHLFPKITDAGKATPDLLTAFRHALVCHPVDAADWRQEATVSITNVRPVRAFAKAVRRSMPELFELEADWMNMLLRLKPAKDGTESTSWFSLNSSEISYSWLIRILIFLAFAIVKAMLR